MPPRGTSRIQLHGRLQRDYYADQCFLPGLFAIDTETSYTLDAIKQTGYIVHRTMVLLNQTCRTSLGLDRTALRVPSHTNLGSLFLY